MEHVTRNCTIIPSTKIQTADGKIALVTDVYDSNNRVCHKARITREKITIIPKSVEN